jgi:hypothetical protein
MKNLQAAVDNGAMPYIAFKSNTQPDRGSDLWSKMFHYYNFKREEFMTHYHQRSNVETTFQMIKAKFGNTNWTLTRICGTVSRVALAI